MNRFYSSDCTAINESNEFIVELGQSDIPIFLNELFLLKMELIENLIISFNGDRDKLEINIDKTLRVNSKSTINKKNNSTLISISENHIDFLCSFILRAYRDQVAEVNHLHIEGKKEGKDFDLTILFDNFSEPMTPEAAKYLMND